MTESGSPIQQAAAPPTTTGPRATLRSRILRSLPRSLVFPARATARFVDRMLGLPFVPWQRGSINMLHVGRCGSTVLGDLLNQHPAVFWDGEVSYRRREALTGDTTPFDVREFIRRQRHVAGSRYYGYELRVLRELEIALAHRTIEQHIADMKSLRFSHYITLERTNYLRYIISTCLGARTRVFHLNQGDKPKLNRVHIDVDRLTICGVEKPLVQRFDELARTFRDLERLLEGERLLKLTYEDDVLPDPRIGYSKICAFLDIPTRDVAVRFSRTNPYPIAEMVENFDDVAGALAGTPHEWMLDA